MNLDLGREQWAGIKRAKELQSELDAAAAAKELAFLKGRLEGLAAVVAGVAEQRAAAATLRSRAEAAEASLSSLQVRSAGRLQVFACCVVSSFACDRCCCFMRHMWCTLTKASRAADMHELFVRDPPRNDCAGCHACHVHATHTIHEAPILRRRAARRRRRARCGARTARRRPSAARCARWWPAWRSGWARPTRRLRA